MSVSGLQCPACGHIHQMAELANRTGGDTFRCTGCKRLLSVPAGMDAPAGAGRFLGDLDADPTGTDGISFPFGSTSTDADRARLGSRTPRPAPPSGPSPAGSWERLGESRDRTAWERPAREQAARQTAGPAPWAEAMPPPASAPAAPPEADRRRTGATRAQAAAPPAGQAARVPALIRFLVWAFALAAGFVVAVFLLRAVGVLEIDHIIDAYAGTGIGRFTGLFFLVPLWAALSSTAAHFAIEWAARRKR